LQFPYIYFPKKYSIYPFGVLYFPGPDLLSHGSEMVLSGADGCYLMDGGCRLWMSPVCKGGNGARAWMDGGCRLWMSSVSS